MLEKNYNWRCIQTVCGHFSRTSSIRHVAYIREVNIKKQQQNEGVSNTTLCPHCSILKQIFLLYG
jgi:hypothetical protein